MLVQIKIMSFLGNGQRRLLAGQRFAHLPWNDSFLMGNTIKSIHRKTYAVNKPTP